VEDCSGDMRLPDPAGVSKAPSSEQGKRSNFDGEKVGWNTALIQRGRASSLGGSEGGGGGGDLELKRLTENG